VSCVYSCFVGQVTRPSHLYSLHSCITLALAFQGLEAFPGNLTPTVCNPYFAPAQAVAVNSMSPAQLHERLHHGVGQATLGDSYESLYTQPTQSPCLHGLYSFSRGNRDRSSNLYATQDLQHQLLRDLIEATAASSCAHWPCKRIGGFASCGG